MRSAQGLEHPLALGDPGLLVSRHVSQPRQQWALGLVPHGMHLEHPACSASRHATRRR